MDQSQEPPGWIPISSASAVVRADGMLVRRAMRPSSAGTGDMLLDLSEVFCTRKRLRRELKSFSRHPHRSKVYACSSARANICRCTSSAPCGPERHAPTLHEMLSATGLRVAIRKGGISNTPLPPKGSSHTGAASWVCVYTPRPRDRTRECPAHACSHNRKEQSRFSKLSAGRTSTMCGDGP